MTVHRIAFRFGSEWRCEPFDSNRRYTLKCEDPRFRLALDSLEGLDSDWLQNDDCEDIDWNALEAPDENDKLHWIECKIAVSAEVTKRTYGIRVYSPNDTQALHLHLWPSEIFGVAEWCRMHDDVATELGFAPWQIGSGPRAFVRNDTDTTFRDARAADQFLSDLTKEITAAHALLAKPYETAEDTDSRLGPENLLVPVWADRRMLDISRWMKVATTSKIRLHARFLAAPKQAKTKPGDTPSQKVVDAMREREQLQARRKSYTEVLKQLRLRQFKVRRIGSQVRHLPRVLPQLTPAMQYDYRMRRLLTGLRTRSDERLARTATTQLSSHQPASSPDLFEAWCAVWCVEVLRSSGWTIEVPHVSDRVFEKDILQASWFARKSGLELIFDWSIRPEVAVLESPPPVDARASSLTIVELFGQWRAQNAAFRGGWAVWPKRKEPDFLVRVRAPGGPWVVGVGDPTLANPAQKSRPDKPETVRKYVGELSWIAAGGSAHRCDPLGGFAMFPGPRNLWSLEDYAARNDCWLVCPEPGVRDPQSEASRTWIGYVEYLTEVAKRLGSGATIVGEGVA